MTYERTGHHSHDMHRRQDDWDEVHNQLLAIQKKSLAVSDPNDADEKEADAVAKKVMDGESSQIHGTGGTINRKGEGSVETTPAFQAKLESSKGGGQSLDESTKSEMESKMGADFSGVKIHTGNEANNMNESVNAKAFAHGQDIYFNSNHSPADKELLAHELVHTVQQGEGKVQAKVQRAEDDFAFDRSEIVYLRDILKIYPNLTPTEATSSASVPGVMIMQTTEFKDLVRRDLVWQQRYQLSYEEAIYVCRQILSKLAAGEHFDWDTQTEDVILDALRTSDSSNEETNFSSRPIDGPYADLLAEFEHIVIPNKGLAEADKGPEPSIDTIRKTVGDYAAQLWALNTTAPDDGSLYVTRILMRMALKQSPVLTKDKNTIQEMVKMFTTLDDVSRGRQDINFDDNDQMRILISGFDPYEGSLTNASGAVVQLLDGTRDVLKYKDAEGNEQNAQVEGTIFPTKYSEFDKGKVEAVFDDYLNPAKGKKVFMVITISLDPNPPMKYNLETHAGGHRGGGAENENVGMSERYGPGDYDYWDQDEIATSIVTRNIEQYRKDGGTDWKYLTVETVQKIKALFSYLDYTDAPPIPGRISTEFEAQGYLDMFLYWLGIQYNYQQQKLIKSPGDQPGRKQYYTTTMKLPSVSTADVSHTGDPTYLRIRNNISYFSPDADSPPTNAAPSTIPDAAQQKGAANKASGGNYLSNEIYYRVSVLGAKYGNAVPNIHIHIPPVYNPLNSRERPETESERKDLPTIRDNVVDAIKQLIEAQW